MNKSNASRIGVLSARVGSISENRLGGWHAYRASKAALIMLLKNYAIEMGYKRRQLILLGLQPGTTETSLSAPFKRNVLKDQLQSPDYTASHLIDVMQRLVLADSGKLYDFLGLPFEP
jgi:NAD(P)-dependent dehydrogenase (short-subunit alcohol dehydrogenase family)